MAVTTLVPISQRHRPREAITHVVRNHIVDIAYSGQHFFGVKFLCESYKAAFCDIYFKAVVVYIPICDLPVVWMQTAFLPLFMLCRFPSKAVQVGFTHHMQKRLRHGQKHLLIHQPHQFISLSRVKSKTAHCLIPCDMLLDFSGFRRILTILARGYLFRADGNAYDRIETARRALLSWCSLSAEKMKKAPDQNDPRLRTDYGEYADEFPELVTPEGEGWLIRHVANIVAFVEANPDAVRKKVVEKAQALKEGFREEWAKKLRHMLVPPFASNTKGAWVLRFDDILADALELGPLKNKDFDLSEDVLQRLAERTPKGVPLEASVMLYKYYIANKEG